MRKVFYFLLVYLFCFAPIHAQDTHFSQYYNTPLLLSPANTALMPDFDYRAGVVLRNQWLQVPAPFRTFSAFADFKVLKNQENTNWLGIGGAFYSDRSGAGDLVLNKVQLNGAYHIQMGLYNMLSIGVGVAFVQRSVDFNKLTYDVQWDGFRFNQSMASGEDYAFQKTSYADLSSGINYAFFPNENVYLKLGIGVNHINRPKESFYNQNNKIGLRPIGNMDLLLKLDSRWILDFSGYYTEQKGASEILYGAQVSSNLSSQFSVPTVLSLGIYNRLGDAIIPTVGLEWNNINVVTSFDISVSSISKANAGAGAFEISFIYKGLYNNSKGRNRSGYSCPRF